MTEAQMPWLQETLRRMEESEQRHASELKYRLEQLSERFEQHVQDDQIVENRVLVIETQRNHEEKQTIKRSTITALIVASGLNVAWEAIKRYLR